MEVIKPVRHMTLDQYLENVAPLVESLKKVLRKKFFYNPYRKHGFEFYTSDEFVEMKVQQRAQYFKGHQDVEESVLNEIMEDERKSSLEQLERQKIKPASKMPEGLKAQYDELISTLKPIFWLPRTVDWSKVHKSHKTEVRLCMDHDVYLRDLMSGKLDFETLESICESVDIRIPKRVYDLSGKTAANQVKGLTKANKAFIEKIKLSLKPYTDSLKQIKTAEIERLLADYAEAGSPDVFQFAENNKLNVEEFRAIYRVLDLGFGKAIESILAEFVNELTLKFLFRVEEYLHVVNEKYGEPEIELGSVRFNAGTIETVIKLTYPHGLTIKGETSLIIAGGAIQRLHYRYLSKFSVDGKTLSCAAIDAL